MFVRELTGGIYFGKRECTPTSASDQCSYTEDEIARVAHVAFQHARQRRSHVCSVDKANVLATSRLWRSTVSRIHHESYSDVTLEHQLVDAMAMHLMTRPSAFDVILTENMFGDILSDEASVLAGSLGVLPSASLGEQSPGVFEPCHGSAPDLEGTGCANPFAAILSGSMLLRHGLALNASACRIEQAVEQVIENGQVTPDLGGHESTQRVADAVIAVLRKEEEAMA